MYGKSFLYLLLVICWLNWCRLFGCRYLRIWKGIWLFEINYVVIVKDFVFVEYKIIFGIIFGVIFLVLMYFDLFIRVFNMINFVFGGCDLSVVFEVLKKICILR